MSGNHNNANTKNGSRRPTSKWAQIRVFTVTLIAVTAVSCAEATVDPMVSFTEESCSSSEVGGWPSSGVLEISVSNSSRNNVAVVMGTYTDGFDHDDLMAYGSDVSTRPEFVDAIEIFQVPPQTTTKLRFDHGPGTYFMVCMPDTNTMVVLDDVAIDS